MDTLATTTADWRARLDAALAARGIEPAQHVPDGETPEDVRDRRAMQAANRASRWRTRLPVMYAEAALADLDDVQHATAIRLWLPSQARTLVLAGTVGAGKTHAAYAVGNHAVLDGKHVEAVTVHDLLQSLRPEGDRDLAYAVRQADLLVMDDLGATKVSPFAVEELTALLDYRLNHGGRQVVTTNATAPLLEEAWGGRFMDRLRYRAEVLVFAGQSRRGDW